jgi:hypothetical protein
MTWIYHQRSGDLYLNREFIGTGYAGRMTNKNNPDRQHVRGLGPLPRGTYHFGQISRKFGPMTVQLVPDATNTMYGRSHFYVHAERRNPPFGWASQGCIVVNSTIRHRLVNSIRGGERQLVVVE